MKIQRLLSALLATFLLSGNFIHAKSLEEETPVLAQALAKQLVTKQRPKVAALDFTNIQGQSNELGRFLAEQLAVDMVAEEGITVLDRANINSVMAEHQLTAEGLVKPENAKKLGQFAGVDALLIGSLASMDKSFILTVKAISTETAEIVAAGRCKFDVTEDLMKQFSSSISEGPTNVSSRANEGSSNPSSHEAKGIATKKFENLEIVLMNVTSSSTSTGPSHNRTAIPVINCSFELFNRDLNNSIVIAANGTLNLENENPTTNQISQKGYRGELNDSSGCRWWLPNGNLRGLSSIMSFETISGGVLGVFAKQSNPTSIVSYVRNGKQCEFGDTDQKVISSSGKYWAGSFSVIQPGKSVRVAVAYIPEVKSGSQDNTIRTPDSFQLDLELIVGLSTDASGEDLKKLKNLRLENLTFDKIVMP